MTTRKSQRDQYAPSAWPPSLRLRIVVRLRRRRFVAEMAAGGNPADDPRLAATAAQLTTAGRRDALADALRRLIEGAERPSTLARVPASRTALYRSRPWIDDLIERLREPTPIYAHGLALLELLVRDGTGSFCCDSDGSTLLATLITVKNAFDGRGGVEGRPDRGVG